MDGFVASKASLGSMRPGQVGKGWENPQVVVDVGGRDMVCHGMSEILVDLVDLSCMDIYGKNMKDY